MMVTTDLSDPAWATHIPYCLVLMVSFVYSYPKNVCSFKLEGESEWRRFQFNLQNPFYFNASEVLPDNWVLKLIAVHNYTICVCLQCT